ncbi:hypothetical protein S245_019619 [Arachis hypogaea]
MNQKNCCFYGRVPKVLILYEPFLVRVSSQLLRGSRVYWAGITLCSLPPNRSLDHVLAHTSSCLLSRQSILPYNLPMRESSLWLHRLNGGLRSDI